MMPIEDAVVLLTSTEPDKNKNFGSAFIIARDDSYSYLLTCAHVIEQINGKEVGINKLKLSGLDKTVEIECCGTSDSIDMALLKVAGLFDKPLFSQFTRGQEQGDIQITGYSLFDVKTGQHIKRPLNGKLGKATKINANNQEYRFWDVAIQDDSFSKLEGGYSGSPLYNQAEQVIGVISHRRSGELGHAFCISNLRLLYPEIETIQPNFKQLIAVSPKMPSLSDIRTRLISRSKEIAKVFLKLRERLNRIEKEGMDDEAEFILQMCEAFLNGEINAGDFIESCFPSEPINLANNQQPNYDLLAQRLKNGEICLCLGAELPKLFDPTLKSVQELPKRIAALTGFENGNPRALAEMCEYAELHTACTRHSVVSELKKLITPPIHHQPKIEFHELLVRLEKPFLIISIGFDTLLEQRLCKSHQRFVSIVTNINAESENQRYLLKYSDRDNSQCSDEQLSALQLMEQGYSLIFHPRGYHDESQDTLLLSERDYFNATHLLQKRYPAYLHNKLKSKGLWFLAYQPDSWETRLLAKVLQYQRGNNNRDLPLVVQPELDSFSQLFWHEMQGLHYPNLSVTEFVAKIAELLK